MRKLLCIGAIALLAAPIAAADLTQEQIKTAENEIIGAWKLDFTTPDDVRRQPMVIIGRQQQELVAWYIEQDQPEPFTKVQLRDETLSLSIRPKQHADVSVTLEATLAKDGVCVGRGSYSADDGETGSWQFKGQRISPSDFDEVEKWQLRFVTPDEQRREAVVTVLAKNDELYGWYSSEEYELPAMKLTKYGDNVVMSVSARMSDGADVDVTFRGIVNGERVSGDAHYDLEGETGTFPFMGQRKS